MLFPPAVSRHVLHAMLVAALPQGPCARRAAASTVCTVVVYDMHGGLGIVAVTVVWFIVADTDA